MSTHNIGFYEDLTKIIFELSSNTHLISSAGIQTVGHSVGIPQSFFTRKLILKRISRRQVHVKLASMQSINIYHEDKT